MNRFVILVALALSGSAMAQNAPTPAPTPRCDNAIVAGFNRQSGQYQMMLGEAQAAIEALQDQNKAAQTQIAEMTKKLEEAKKPAPEASKTPAPAPTPSPK